jgi:MoaA/NifB/PqqE/SkfB family radical SAM enzyme
MWVNHYKDNTLSVLVEVSSSCNAACPQCDRFKPNTLETYDFLKNRQWTLSEFVQAFPVSELMHIKELVFSGLYGEPTTCKDLSEMVQYVRTNAPQILIYITTNGSTRTADWWYKLGLIGGNQLRVQFDVDGINQEMHSTYRRNTSLEKILNNMNAFSKANPNHTDVFTVVYTYNEKHLSEIQEITKQHGAVHWDQIESGRFNQERGAVYTYIDNRGIKHELVQIDKEMHSWIPHIRRIRNFSLDKMSYSDDTHEIVCAAGSAGRLQIDYNGNIWPCCYLITATDHKMPDTVELQNLRASNKMSLFHHTLGEIIKSNWYTTELSESITSCNTANLACIKWCGRKKGSNIDRF